MPEPLRALLLDTLRLSAMALERLDGQEVVIELEDRSIRHPAAALGVSRTCREAWEALRSGDALPVVGNQVRSALEGAKAAFTTLHGASIQAPGAGAVVSDQTASMARCAAALEALDEVCRHEMA